MGGWRHVRVCVGGTFHPFHSGHEALLSAAADGADHVFVGVTDGPLAARQDRNMPSWSNRAATVREFLAEHGFAGEVVVEALQDSSGPAVTGDFDAIAVSWDTRGGADAINVAREQGGREPLAVRVVPPVLADDLLPISATRIARGDIDRAGRRLTAVRVAVGSANPVKVAGVEAAIADILHVPVAVQGHGVSSGVPEQPRDDETLHGARNRAAKAMDAWPQADYAVGIEAGLHHDAEAHFDVQCCVIHDLTGHESRGWGPAFSYPDWVTRRALDGEMISAILGPVAGDPRIGGTTGAIGFLTDGLLDRTALTRQAVVMAFVPRIRRALYEVESSNASLG